MPLIVTIVRKIALMLSSIMVTYCHVDGKDDISHKGERVASIGTSGPNTKGEPEARE
jgi:hypothetical protein